MKHKLYLLPVLGLLLGLAGCKTGPVFPLEPEIEFEAISPGEAQQLTGEIEITIHFQDGDGDLGEDGAEVTNLYVQDTRPVFDTLPPIGYSIPNLTPDTKNPSIQGTLTANIPTPPLSSFIPGQPDVDEEYAVFRVWLFDRAGNRSNDILTDPIRIYK